MILETTVKLAAIAFLAVVLFVIGVLAGSMARDAARPLPHEETHS